MTIIHKGYAIALRDLEMLKKKSETTFDETKICGKEKPEKGRELGLGGPVRV